MRPEEAKFRLCSNQAQLKILAIYVKTGWVMNLVDRANQTPFMVIFQFILKNPVFEGCDTQKFDF